MELVFSYFMGFPVLYQDNESIRICFWQNLMRLGCKFSKVTYTWKFPFAWTTFVFQIRTAYIFGCLY
jgi:hypothetical protein